MLYSETTDNIEVTVRPMYRHKDSSPKTSLYVWCYEVRISNQSEQTVQLINRTWNIVNAEGEVEKVHGPGVVGEQPIIPPGHSFEYSSFTHLATSSGFMRGRYDMMDESERMFSIKIPQFDLKMPVRLVTPASPHQEETPELFTSH